MQRLIMQIKVMEANKFTAFSEKEVKLQESYLSNAI